MLPNKDCSLIKYSVTGSLPLSPLFKRLFISSSDTISSGFENNVPNFQGTGLPLMTGDILF